MLVINFKRKTKRAAPFMEATRAANVQFASAEDVAYLIHQALVRQIAVFDL